MIFFIMIPESLFIILFELEDERDVIPGLEDKGDVIKSGFEFKLLSLIHQLKQDSGLFVLKKNFCLI